MEDFSKLFDNESQSMFYKSRPEYSPTIIKEMIDFWKTFNTDCESETKLNIVDVGCGTGQLTKELIPFSKSIIGIDSSESQIKEAKCLFELEKNIKFIVCSCYDIPVPDKSIDMITAAQCLHWFDVDKFYTEVTRCLKIGGVFIICMYLQGHFVINGKDDRNSELNQFLTKDLWFGENYFSCVSKEVLWALNSLEGLPFLYPSTGIRKNDLSMEMKIPLSRYEKFIRSTSIYQQWKKQHLNDTDLADIAMEKILSYLGNPETLFDTIVVVKYPITLIMCSKV